MNELQPRPSPRTVRKSILLLAALNGAAALLAVPVGSLAVGAGKLSLLSDYRELELQGLFNDERIQTYNEGQFAGEWTEIPDYLGERAFSRVQQAAVLAALLFAANALLTLTLLRCKE